MKYLLTVALVLAALPISAQGIQKYSFPPTPEMERADIYAVTSEEKPAAVLVLCPGRNHNGGEWIQEPAWQDFAKEHHLGLMGVSFASPDSVIDQGNGYPRASQGSGQILLDAVHKIYGNDLPIILYGFSAGAVFSYEFVEWKPGRVVAWCAYAGNSAEQTKHNDLPPGIIACGEYDASRYGESLSYFKKGRALGKPWLWISLGKWDHVRSPELEDFARQYFHAVLEKTADPCWVDVDFKKEVSSTEAAQVPSVSGWLPSQALLNAWSKIHEP